MKRTLVYVTAMAVCLGIGSVSVRAHHGDAGRYDEQIVELTGVIVETQMINPHALLILNVADRSGKMVKWQAELGAAVQLMRGGWNIHMKPGTKVTVTGRRLKSGAPYMNLTERARVVVTESGQEVYRTANYGQPAPAATR
jgi:hypothetical protein